MTSTIPASGCRRAVLLPGTGSDEVFIGSVFRRPLADAGIDLHAVIAPAGTALVTASLAELDAAAADGPIIAGGISLGAHLAAQWALANPRRCAGLLLALPGWVGQPAEAPAAVAARLGAANIEREGMAEAIRTAIEGVDGWLAGELRRAWQRHGPALAASMRVAANHPAPSVAELRALRVPAGVAGCVDDPVHPARVARRWAGALPIAELASTTLAAIGADRQSLGRATLAALLRAVP
ncbi:MAG: alpha/beta fold hydrolase [Sciscionella sp.]